MEKNGGLCKVMNFIIRKTKFKIHGFFIIFFDNLS